MGKRKRRKESNDTDLASSLPGNFVTKWEQVPHLGILLNGNASWAGRQDAQAAYLIHKFYHFHNLLPMRRMN